MRLLSSGPRAGIGEIILPTVQAGSSIMPGKVNPVIPEVVNQVAYQVVGNDLTVTMAAESGQLQLNAMEPVIIYNVMTSMTILTNALSVLTKRCVNGIEVDIQRCQDLVEGSLISATSLAPIIGYEAASNVAKEALLSGQTIRSVIIEKALIPTDQLDELFKPEKILGYSL